MQHIQKMSRMNKYIGLSLTNGKLKRKKKNTTLKHPKELGNFQDGDEKKGGESNLKKKKIDKNPLGSTHSLTADNQLGE